MSEASLSLNYDELTTEKVSHVSGNRSCHALNEAESPKSKSRTRCCGCYEKISMNDGSKTERAQARRVSTSCPQCKGKPHLWTTCFAAKLNIQRMMNRQLIELHSTTEQQMVQLLTVLTPGSW